LTRWNGRWIGLAAVTLLPATLHAGTIRGTLRVPVLPPAAQAPERYPGRADAMPGMHTPARGLVTDAVISVDHVPAEREALEEGELVEVRLF